MLRLVLNTRGPWKFSLANIKKIFCRSDLWSKISHVLVMAAWNVFPIQSLTTRTTLQTVRISKAQCTVHRTDTNYGYRKVWWRSVYLVQYRQGSSIKLCKGQLISKCFFGISNSKVHIFWKGHKILRNLHLTFDRHYIGQK